MERTLGNSPKKGGRGVSGNTHRRGSMISRQSAPKGCMAFLSGERRIYVGPQDTLLQDSLERWGSLSHTVRAGSPSKGVLANIDRAGYTLCPKGSRVGQGGVGTWTIVMEVPGGVGYRFLSDMDPHGSRGWGRHVDLLPGNSSAKGRGTVRDGRDPAHRRCSGKR